MPSTTALHNSATNHTAGSGVGFRTRRAEEREEREAEPVRGNSTLRDPPFFGQDEYYNSTGKENNHLLLGLGSIKL